jgi:hypothetical protein
MNPKKFLKRAASMGMALLLLVGVVAPAQAAYSPPDGASTGSEKSITLNLTATLKTEGDTLPSDAEFTFVLLPDKETYPMPEEGGETVVLKEAGLIKFGEITLPPLASTAISSTRWRVRTRTTPLIRSGTV